MLSTGYANEWKFSGFFYFKPAAAGFFSFRCFMMIRFFETGLERDCRYWITVLCTVHRSPMWFTQLRHVDGINILSIKSLTLVGPPTIHTLTAWGILQNRQVNLILCFCAIFNSLCTSPSGNKVEEGTGLIQWALCCSCGLDRPSLQVCLGQNNLQGCLSMS